MPNYTARLAVIIASALLLLSTWQILTSPWLAWFGSAVSENHILLNTSKLNAAAVNKSLPTTLPISSSSISTRLRRLPTTITRKALAKTLRVLVVDRAPIQPLFIANWQPNNGAERLLAIGTLTRHEARIGIGPTTSTASAQLRTKTVAEVLPVYDLTITVPSFALRTLPSRAHDHWNNLLRDRLRLTGTNPDILGYISQFDTTKITLAGDTLAISTTGAVSALATTVEEWVQTAERIQRPQPHTFILPDGTRGVETIPGETREVFKRSTDNCRGPVSELTAVWICQWDQHVTISNRQELAQSQPPISEGWELSVTSAALAQSWCTADQPADLLTVLLCGATSISAEGADNTAAIVLTFE